MVGDKFILIIVDNTENLVTGGLSPNTKKRKTNTILKNPLGIKIRPGISEIDSLIKFIYYNYGYNYFLVVSKALKKYKLFTYSENSNKKPILKIIRDSRIEKNIPEIIKSMDDPSHVWDHMDVIK